MENKIDYSKFSDDDLRALYVGDIKKLSDDGLRELHKQQAVDKKPTDYGFGGKYNEALTQAARPSAASLSSGTEAASRPLSLEKAITESALVSFWSALLAFIIFRASAYKYWKKPRVTATQNGSWCGGIAASLVPFGVQYKIAQRAGAMDYAMSLLFMLILYFAVAFSAGWFWRKLKKYSGPA